MSPRSFTLEEILLAQPLNPLRKVTFTAMPRFPLIQPPAEPVVVEQTSKLVKLIRRGDFTDGRETARAEIIAVYENLDEVIV